MKRFGLTAAALVALLLTAGRAPAQTAPADALDVLNAQRAARGLPPYQRDDGLTAAARAAAEFRAARLIAGHTASDFVFLPAGARADAAGCAAWPPSLGFGACCDYDVGWTFAGAASVAGRDGRLYHHLFVRHGGPAAPSATRMPAPIAAAPCPTCGPRTSSATVTMTVRERVWDHPQPARHLFHRLFGGRLGCRR